MAATTPSFAQASRIGSEVWSGSNALLKPTVAGLNRCPNIYAFGYIDRGSAAGNGDVVSSDLEAQQQQDPVLPVVAVAAGTSPPASATAGITLSDLLAAAGIAIIAIMAIIAAAWNSALNFLRSMTRKLKLACAFLSALFAIGAAVAAFAIRGHQVLGAVCAVGSAACTIISGFLLASIELAD